MNRTCTPWSPTRSRTCLSASLLVVALVAMSLESREAGAQFTAITKAPLGDNGSGFGVCWGDFDRDGDPDLYITNDGSNLLLRNDGSDFSDATAPPLDNADNGSAAAWADYDDDGDLDLYLVNYLASNRLFRNDCAQGFTDVTSGPLGDSGPGTGAAWADYDLDGDVDLYVVNYGTPNKLLRNDGGAGFVDATTGPLGDAGWGYGVCWGDYDNDGDPDLYVVNDGPNRLLRNDGGGNFTRIPGLAIEEGGPGQGAAWGDYDNDGDLDLYVTNYGTPNKLIRNDGGNLFTWITAGPLGDPGNGTGLAWGDYDNDGDVDLYLANYGQANKLLRNEGGGVFTSLGTGPLGDTGNGTGVAWADYDGDGDLDLYLVNDGSANRLLRNDLTSPNHWLHIDLVGRVSSRDAIGARVRVVAGSLRQIREVSGGSGYMSQDSPTLEFGLGPAALADSVIVRWPSGYVEAYTAVPLDRKLTLTELDVSAVDVSPAATIPPKVQFAPPAPNPARDKVVFRFGLPQPARVRISIFDVRGRLVRTTHEAYRAGWHETTWRLRDRQGRSIAAGIYVARLEMRHHVVTRKLVLAR